MEIISPTLGKIMTTVFAFLKFCSKIVNGVNCCRRRERYVEQVYERGDGFIA